MNVNVVVIGLFCIIGVLIGAGLYLGGTYLRAWFEVKALPKSEVFLCDKHGPIQKESTITFMGVPYCPRCFHERMNNAERILGQ